MTPIEIAHGTLVNTDLICEGLGWVVQSRERQWADAGNSAREVAWDELQRVRELQNIWEERLREAEAAYQRAQNETV